MKTTTESEETVQRVLGPLMPCMSPDRWEGVVKPAIAKMLSEEVCRARDEAQALVFRMELRHDEELEKLKAEGRAYRYVLDAADHRRNGKDLGGTTNGR